MGKSERNIPLGRSNRRRNDNIETYLEEIGSESVHWIHLVWNSHKWRAVVNTVMSSFIKCGGIFSY
jgi:hypothetical protein